MKQKIKEFLAGLFAMAVIFGTVIPVPIPDDPIPETKILSQGESDSGNTEIPPACDDDYIDTLEY